MLYSVKEPKNKRAKRALQAREPKMVENEKRAMLLHGHSCSQAVKMFLDELVSDRSMSSGNHFALLFSSSPGILTGAVCF